MRFSRFFIARPIFAAVLSLFITILGVIAYFSLPLTQFPEIVPPTVTVIGHLSRAPARRPWPIPSPPSSSRR